MASFAFLDSLQQVLEADSSLREQLRETVKQLEKQCRLISAILNKVHAKSDKDRFQTIATEAKEQFGSVRASFKKLEELVPPNLVYKYNDHWSRTAQNCVFLAAYITYLEKGTLLTTSEAEALLGVSVSAPDKFEIGIEDFLHGLVSLTSELSRLATNSVTVGDYNAPIQISRFLSDLYAGFQLLNLKNDSLRKRFDGIKYDVRQVEEVVYDISVRSLASKQ